MLEGTTRDVAHRYVGWLRRRGAVVVMVAAAALALSTYLIGYHLPLDASFAALLPPDAPSVRDLHRLEARVADKDTALVVLAAPDPATRAAAAAMMAERLRALPPTLVHRVEDDDAAARAFVRAHAHLFVPLADLIAARDALAERIAIAKRDANPLFVRLDDDDDQALAATEARLDELRQRRQGALDRLARSSNVSADGLLQLLVIRTAFEKQDIASGQRLVRALRAARAEVIRAHPTVTIGLTGGVVTTVAEHDALFHGVVLSTLVTATLVGLVLVLYFRSAILLVVLGLALLVGTLAAFGVAALTVGHLNVATAFLGAIIAGNGVNYGILLIGRYLEERRRREPDDALAVAIHGTLRPTLVAALGAAIAYGSLRATSFRGFADFAIIGAIGMLLCWIAAYTLLPVLVLRLAARPRLPVGEPVIGRVLARVLGFRRPARVVAATVLVAGLAVAVGYRYVAGDPLEYDITNLRSNGPASIEVRRWMTTCNHAFDRGISSETFIALDALADVDPVLAALGRADHLGQAPTIGRLRSIRDVVPADQDAKLAVLSEIRTLLDDDALAALDDQARAELATLRRPDDLRPITVASLPPELSERLQERDGRVGLLLAIRPAPGFDEWNGHDLIRFAGTIRRLDLGDGRTVTTAGASVVFADIVDAIEHDGLRVTAVAAFGLAVMVLVVVGRNRRAASVLAATTLGALGLVATCALLGLRVNFLDFIALPITLGLGIAYAINVAHRHAGEDHGPLTALRTSGSAVFVCSLTTIIGWGSLLVSENLAIRGFGTAALIGEVVCLTTALIVVPAVVSLGARDRSRIV